LIQQPVLIPTSVGTVGGIITEPITRPRAAALLLSGAGGCGRAGVNAFWAGLARELAERGVINLRFDYPHRGNGSIAVPPGIDMEAREDARESIDIAATREAAIWLRERTDGLDLLVAGECHGGRLALELLPYQPDIAGLFVVAPYLRESFAPLVEREMPGAPDDDSIEILDERMLASLRELLERGRPAWVLIGGEEGSDPARLKHRLGSPGRRLEVEVAPGYRLHPVAAPDVQAEVRRRLTRRIARALDPSPGTSAPPSGVGADLPPGPDMPPTRQAARWAMRQLAFLQEAAARHGDVFTLRLLGDEPFVVVGDPELVKQVICAPADVLHAGEGNRRVLGPLLGPRSLFLLDGERHMAQRRLLLPAFHGRRLERYAETMRAVAEAHLDAWPRGEAVATLPRMRELALETMLRTVFGPGEGSHRASLREAVLAASLPANPEEGVSPPYRRVVERVEALIADEVARRRATSGSDPGEDDILSFLLEARLDDGSPLPDVDLSAELMTLVVAGTETTAASLAWALELLARAPLPLETVAAEVASGGGAYLDAVVHETLRMRPALPTFARLAKQPFELGDHLIPEGTRIAPSVLLVHHHPEVYPEPLAFQPERFLGGRPGTYTWIPFGGGVRRCIGSGFALMEMRAVLAALLLRMTPRAPSLEPEPMRNRAVLTVPARQAQIVLHHRAVPAVPGPAGVSR
jgi:cytochrome P450 family 135